MLITVTEDTLPALIRNLNHQNAGRFIKHLDAANCTALLHFDNYPDYIRFCSDRGLSPVGTEEYVGPYYRWLGSRQPEPKLFRKYVRGDLS